MISCSSFLKMQKKQDKKRLYQLWTRIYLRNWEKIWGLRKIAIKILIARKSFPKAKMEVLCRVQAYNLELDKNKKTANKIILRFTQQKKVLNYTMTPKWLPWTSSRLYSRKWRIDKRTRKNKWFERQCPQIIAINTKRAEENAIIIINVDVRMALILRHLTRLNKVHSYECSWNANFEWARLQIRSTRDEVIFGNKSIIFENTEIA